MPTQENTHNDVSAHAEGAPSQPRRAFLTQAGVAGLAAGGLLANFASAQTPAVAGSAGLGAILFPGAVDAAGAYVLPPLPYAYDALEPHIDKETMTLHHDKHHQAYVDGLKKAEAGLAKARTDGDFAQVKALSRDATFHGGGHFLHCLFWACMKPGGGKPEGDLAAQIAKDFGSQDAFEKHFAAAAAQVEGSGWAMLVWSLPAKKLLVLQAENQNLLTQWGELPILAIDMWEHAYYKKYSNVRADYIKAWMSVVDWASTATRFAAVSKT